MPDDLRWDLLEAIGHGDADSVRALLAAGATVDGRPSGVPPETPLGLASRLGDAEIVRALLAAGAPVLDEASWPPLEIAAAQGHVEVARLLIEAGAPIDGRSESGFTALMAAAQGGRRDMVRFLAEAGANLDLDDGDFGCALFQAVEGGFPEIVRDLLDAGAEADAYERPEDLVEEAARIRARLDWQAERRADESARALHEAAEQGRLAKLQGLLAEGLDPNVRNEYGETALFRAAFSGQLEAARILLEAGADPMARTIGGRTLLHEAAEGGQPTLAQLLLDEGVEPDVRDDQGMTALWLAAMDLPVLASTPRSGQIEVARVLLAAGADQSQLRMGAHTNHLETAMWRGDLGLLHLLIEAGSDLKGKTAQQWIEDTTRHRRGGLAACWGEPGAADPPADDGG
jgi:ankyrin repeat protein